MKKIFLLLAILMATGCGGLGGGAKIDVPKRMSQAQEQGNCQPQVIYEKTEEGEYKKTHEFAMVCK